MCIVQAFGGKARNEIIVRLTVSVEYFSTKTRMHGILSVRLFPIALANRTR